MNYLRIRKDPRVFKELPNTYIVSNQIRCHNCGGEPWSGHRHDYRTCECGAVAVDGGQEYLRRVGEQDSYTDMSIVMDKLTVDRCEIYAERAMETGRNPLGVALAVLRALRDSGVELNGKDVL